MNKQQFDFTLVLSGVRQDTPNLEDALYESGCDDALIVYKNNYVMLDFTREAVSLEKAIESAIDQIESAGLGAMVDHIEGEYATISELAKITGYTKQGISLFMKGKRGDGDFPVPAFGLNCQSPVWSVYDVCKWIEYKKNPGKMNLSKYKTIHDINGQLRNRHK